MVLRVCNTVIRRFKSGLHLQTKEHCESSALLFGNEAHLRCMKNEAGLRPMNRAFGSRRTSRALRFMRAKIAEQFASASRRNAPLHVCEANAVILEVAGYNLIFDVMAK